MLNLFQKKKETNYGKIVAITVAAVAGACAVAVVLFKLYQKYIACKLVLDDDDCLCDCDCDCDECDCDCDCDECDCECDCELCDDAKVEETEETSEN